MSKQYISEFYAPDIKGANVKSFLPPTIKKRFLSELGFKEINDINDEEINTILGTTPYIDVIQEIEAWIYIYFYNFIRLGSPNDFKKQVKKSQSKLLKKANILLTTLMI